MSGEEEVEYLTLEELQLEALLCARYGDTEDLASMISMGVDVNFQDEQGNTSMHMAAANGHIDVLKLLHQHNAKPLANREGNLPIHWAAQNSQLEAMKFLLENFEFDVLQTNGFNKSTLTEAFSSNNSDLIALCLTHSSATDERLIPQKAAKESNDEDEAADSANNAVSHEMDFNKRRDPSISNRVLKLRELPIARADSPFGTDSHPEDDTTGLGVWPASILTARYALANKHRIEGNVVVELGAGCGLPAIAAALYCKPKLVYLTDINPRTLENAAYNARLNGVSNLDENAKSSHDSNLIDEVKIENEDAESTILRVTNVNWLDTKTYPMPGEVDVIIGSDLVYDVNILPPLALVVTSLLKSGGSFFYVAPNENRDGMKDLVIAMKEANILLVSQEPCPEEMYENPLLGDNADDNYVLHFYDLPAKVPFSLYHFMKL